MIMNDRRRQQVAAAAAAAMLMMSFIVSDAGLSCAKIVSLLMPCVYYMNNGVPASPPRQCCSGVRTLFAASKTAADKRAACECLKRASNNIHVKSEYVSKLPAKCGVPFHFNQPITHDFDCNRIR